jgi:hypothetical protein
MGRGNEEMGYSQMKSLIKGYRRVKVGTRCSTALLTKLNSVIVLSFSCLSVLNFSSLIWFIAQLASVY